MGIPVIPEVTQEQALIDLLESIALEETALAHLINAEAEKVQVIAEMLLNDQATLDETIDIQQSVAGIMKTVIKKQILLQFKLENVLDAMSDFIIRIHTNTAIATGFFNFDVYSDTDAAYYSYRKGQNVGNIP